MKFNYENEKKKFENKWKKLAREYKEAGMSEENIQKMFDFDWKEFRRQRIETIHTQMQYSDIDELYSDIYLYEKFSDELSTTIEDLSTVSRYWWIESINDHRLAKALKALSDEDKEILTLYIIDGFTQTEIAEKKGIQQKRVSRRLVGVMKKLIKSLKNSV